MKLQQSSTRQHSEDVAKLLGQYKNGLQHYHEIQLDNSIQEIRSRWPLLEEITNEVSSR